MAIRVGSTIGGRYHLIATIAKGGMGAVYEAFDERLQRNVALKVLLPELAEDRESLARFEREALAAARLAHPSIVAVHDFGIEPDGAHYLVMEKVAGRTLSQLLGAEGRLAPERAADIALQSLGALAHAHASGVVHRDLKPGNLMLVPLGADRELVMVLDFGLAQLKTSAGYARLTQTGAIIGTPVFMAPEQARGEVADARTDVYAMGVLLWCLLTGTRPFLGADMGAVLMQVLKDAPPRADALAPDVPAALADVVATAMEKDPSRRYASADAFARAITDTSVPTGARSLAAPARAAPLPSSTSMSAAAAQGALPGTRTSAEPSAAATFLDAPSRASASIAARPETARVIATERAPAPPRLGSGARVGLLVLVAALFGTFALFGTVTAILVVPRLLGAGAAGEPASSPSVAAGAPAPQPLPRVERVHYDPVPQAPSASPCFAAAECCSRMLGVTGTAPVGDCNMYRSYADYGMAEECRTILGSYRDMIRMNGSDPNVCEAP